MRKINLLFTVVTAFTSQLSAQIFMAKTCEVTFFSQTPIEDITASSKIAKPLLNTKTQDVQVKIPMTSFVFEKPLMQEHFNENYVESEKFPFAIFKGKINEKTDFTADGENNVTVTGIMSLHGVDKEYTMPGKLIIKGGQITISSTFKITFADHKIIIPSLYAGVFPPDTEVKINSVLEPFQKK
jgi:hypothetical protein